VTVDGLVFLGTSRFGTGLDLPTLRESMAAAGIDAAVVAPPHPPDGDLRRATAEVAEAARSSGGALAALARVDPWDGQEGLDHLAEAIESLGVRGVFLHPAEENFPILAPVVRPVVDAAAAAGLPVVVASGYPWLSEPIQVAALARQAPSIPVVATNGGQYNISGLSQADAELALQHENVHILTTGVYREDFLQNVVSRFGADRVLFGSGAPLFDLRYELLRVEKLDVPEVARTQLLSANSSRLFGLDRG
jgi:predicted TIM-barrel fold metal-dependent hydrolase